MTPDSFRQLALTMPEAIEVGHMGHPDFRVGGKIFATLGYPDDGWAMVKLSPEQQEAFVAAERAIFKPVAGGWGRQGATNVRLRGAKAPSVRTALLAAWRNVAPARLAKQVQVALGRSTVSGHAHRAGPPRGTTWPRLCADAGRLAGVEPGTSYRTPALYVRRTLLARLREDQETVAVRVDFEDRDVVLEADPSAFFLTEHYRAYPWVLARLAKVRHAAVMDLLERAWRRAAPRRLVESAPRADAAGAEPRRRPPGRRA